MGNWRGKFGYQDCQADAGGVQGNVILKYGMNNLLATAGAGAAITLPQAKGTQKIVETISRSSWMILTYPFLGDQMMYFGANIGWGQYPLTYMVYRDTKVGQWDFVYNIAGNFPVFPNVTAFAGGGQGSATQLQYGSMTVGICATAGDSVKMPIALGAGVLQTVSNVGAAACNLFPATGQKFNNLAANAAFSIPVGRMAIWNDIGPPNQWVGGLAALT